MYTILSTFGKLSKSILKPAKLSSGVRGPSILSEDILKTNIEEWKNNKVVFAWQGEDYRPITKALEIKEGSTIFTIASAGYNPSMLLLENPGKVVMVDINPTQIAWCMLYFSAIKNLSYEEFRGLVGFGEGANVTPDERIRLYESLRSTLPSKAQMYWDNHKEAMTKSGMYLFANCIRLWGLERFVSIAHSQETLDKFLSFKNIEEQRVFFEEQWDTWRWRRAFVVGHMNVSPDIFGPFVAILPQLAPRWMNRFKEVCTNVPNMDNPHIEILLTGRISGKNSLPDFWKPENYIPIRERLDRFELIHADANEYFKHTSEKFDGFVLSNVGDAYSKEQHDQWITNAISSAKPGSRLTYLSGTGLDKGWPEALKDKIQIEDELSKSLVRKVERGIFWDDMHIASMK